MASPPNDPAAGASPKSGRDMPGSSEPSPLPSGGTEKLGPSDIDALLNAAKAAESGPAAARGGDATRRPPSAGRTSADSAVDGGRPADRARAAPSEPLERFEPAMFEPAAMAQLDAKRVSMLNDVQLRVKIELGRTRMLVEDVLKLAEGSVVELDKLAGDPVDVYVNDRLMARGEVLVLNDVFCVRVSEVLSHDPHRVCA